MVRRLDLLGECNDQQVPYEDFRLQFCIRCQQPECTRSRAGTSKFDQRVATWQERLFEQVPRMDPGDPRFMEIQAKQFKMFNPGVVPTRGAWIDPTDLVDSVPPPALVVPEPPPIVTQIVEVPAPLPEVQAPVAATASTEEPAKVAEPAQPVKLTPQLLRMNTPSQTGRMLANSPPPKAPAPPKDPWAAPEPQKKTEQGVVVVKRGATVRLGGNGVE